MPDLKGTRTEQNLKAAFSGESEARNKYTYYASKAKKEGYEQIAGFFQETADNEKEHAKLWLKHLGGIGDTMQNLRAAASGEHFEWTEMYKEFAAVAREEGFDEIADQMERVGEIERHHEARYRRLLTNIETGKAFKREEKTSWICRNCGYIMESAEAPALCLACKHPQSFFQILAEDY